MFKKSLLVSGALIALSLTGMAQQLPVLFPDKSTVCFVGNSITQNGEYIHYIRSYYATRYPARQVKMFNCGISGDVTGGILARMQPDIMARKPDYAVIMIGMNDVNRPLYDARNNGIDSIQKKKAEALATYKANLTKIVAYLVEKKVKVILQKPSIYDQTGKLGTNNLFGVNDALKTCAGYMQELANKYKLPVVDYWTIMTNVNKVMQSKDSTATIVGKDRVHPASPGHFTMGYQFLHTTLGKVPAVSIKLAPGKKKPEVSGATFTEFSYGSNHIGFTYKPASLPYFVNPAAAPALEYIPFTKELNTELLQITDMPAGNYALMMNNVMMGEFTAADFAKGINLASLNTPAAIQAKKVVEYCEDIRKHESDMRQIRHMEYRTLWKLPNGNNRDSGIAILKRKLADTAVKGNERTNFERYLKNKAHETELYKAFDTMYKKLYTMNKPETIRVRIQKM